MKVGKMSNRKILMQVCILCLCVVIGWTLKAKLTPQQAFKAGGQMPDPFVVAEQVILTDITPTQKYIAHVEAVNEVNIQPQVNGYLEKVMFKEGSLVKKGDLLFVIEQQRYIATEELRKAELDKAKASFIQLEKEYKRQKSLNLQKFASEQKLDEAYSKMLQAKASVKQAEANYKLAKIDLEHTEIRSPIDGYIGKAMVTIGNYVSASGTVLANIVQTNPVRVVFSVTDKEMMDLKENYARTQEELYSKIVLSNGSVLQKPILSYFADNAVNSGTATLSIYSEFANDNGLLIPGSYVDILLGSHAQGEQITVSQAALAQDEIGNYVMSVNKQNIVEERRVTLGKIINNRQVVLDGLTKDDRVIIKGLQKVTDGKKVRVSVINEKK